MRVHSGTAAAAARRYSEIMTLEQMKIAVVIAWALIWSVITVSLVSSVGNWILVVGSGVLPPLMILRMWQPPAQTVPAGSREARR